MERDSIMIYGYARVSSTTQTLEPQLEALNTHGCSTIYQEKLSGRKKENREQFQLLLDTVVGGDTIVITKLDRMARNTKDALDIIEQLNEKKVSLVVLNLGGQVVDTSTAIGKMLVTVLSAIAEFEVDLIKERQLEGIRLAKERGVYKGRPTKYTKDNPAIQKALELVKQRHITGMSMEQIAKGYGISRKTLYNKCQEFGIALN